MHYERLEKALSYVFVDKNILSQALTHRSYLNENQEYPFGHNERLEFLGDAILEMIVTEYLYYQYPEKSEGELTAIRSALVKGEHLAKIAEGLDLIEYLLISRGERNDSNSWAYITANAIEALIAALYIDGGITITKNFIVSFILKDLDIIIEDNTYIDAKSQLQEYIQHHFGITPHYTVISSSGPDHNKNFVVSVFRQSIELGQGQGSSKQKAEQDAAKKALTRLLS